MKLNSLHSLKLLERSPALWPFILNLNVCFRQNVKPMLEVFRLLLLGGLYPVVRCMHSDCPSVISSVKIKFSDCFWPFLPFGRACFPYLFLWHIICDSMAHVFALEKKEELFISNVILKRVMQRYTYFFKEEKKITHNPTAVSWVFKLLLFIFQSFFTGTHF